MLRKLYSSFFLAFSLVGMGSVATSVALACTDHSSQPVTPSNIQASTSRKSHRPTWSHEMLEVHNQWRQRTGIPPLIWSDDLATHAQAWANHLANDNFRLYHRPNNPYGENLTWAAHQTLSPTQVVNMWGDEIKDYDYDTNRCTAVCGHYTQLVWQKTTEVGCANVRSGSQEIWVCNYNPPGNYRGQKPYQTVFQSEPANQILQRTASRSERQTRLEVGQGNVLQHTP